MKRKTSFLLVIALLLMLGVTAYAASGYTMTYKPGTTDTVTNMPQNDSGMGGDAYNVSSTVPQRAGYEFLGWELDYDVAYKVTYVVNPDPIYRVPEDSEVPTDPTRYAPNAYVYVADPLTTTVDYAFNENSEKVRGTWKFETWDKEDFTITEDTTITGGWVFEPAPAKTYKYTVYYKLYEGNIATARPVHDPTHGEVPALGTTVPIDAIPVKELKVPFKNPKKYEIRPGYQHVDVTITHDNYEITIWYQPINTAG